MSKIYYFKNQFAKADPVSLSEPEPETVLEPVHNVSEQLQETTKHQTTVVNFTEPKLKHQLIFDRERNLTRTIKML